MKRLIFSLIIIQSTIACWGQDISLHQSSTISDNSRFQIVQSELGVRYTFNIDKYTGSVFLLVEGTDGITWKLIEAELQAYNEKKENQINYQLFTSGIGVRYTFLMNVNTGITWQLVEDPVTKNLFWAKIQ